MSWEVIGTKDVYTVDNHHDVIMAWHRQFLKAGPIALISFDYHTDLRKAFSLRASQASLIESGQNQFIQNRLSRVDITCSSSIASAITELRHDEHIDFAIQTGIVKAAFVSLGCGSPGMPHKDVHVYSFDPCIPTCRRSPHNEACLMKRAGMVIESEILSPRVVDMEKKIGCGLHAGNMVLDVDLDIFNRRKAIAPNDISVFHHLIQSAMLVTIAREPNCVANLKLVKDKKLNANYLEKALKKIIANSLLNGSN
jgi:hypothetical protein